MPLKLIINTLSDIRRYKADVFSISLLTQTNKKEPANKEAWAETRRSTVAVC